MIKLYLKLQKFYSSLKLGDPQFSPAIIFNNTASMYAKTPNPKLCCKLLKGKTKHYVQQPELKI